MTHQSGHIIVKLSMPMDSDKPNGMKVYHCALIIAVAAFVLGLLAGALA